MNKIDITRKTAEKSLKNRAIYIANHIKNDIQEGYILKFGFCDKAVILNEQEELKLFKNNIYCIFHFNELFIIEGIFEKKYIYDFSYISQKCFNYKLNYKVNIANYFSYKETNINLLHYVFSGKEVEKIYKTIQDNHLLERLL